MVERTRTDAAHSTQSTRSNTNQFPCFRTPLVTGPDFASQDLRVTKRGAIQSRTPAEHSLSRRTVFTAAMPCSERCLTNGPRRTGGRPRGPLLVARHRAPRRRWVEPALRRAPAAKLRRSLYLAFVFCTRRKRTKPCRWRGPLKRLPSHFPSPQPLRRAQNENNKKL